MSSTAVDPTASVSSDDDSNDPSLDLPEAPRLVIALDASRPTDGAVRVSLLDADEAVIGRGPARDVARDGRAIRIYIEDTEASRHHLTITRRAAGWEAKDLGSKNGTSVNGARLTSTILADADVIEVGGTFLVFREAPAHVHHLEDRSLRVDDPDDAALATLNNDLEWRFADVAKIAAAEVPVLIRGETGTGKELVARAIHARSERPGPFVPVNCGALPRALIESELFGYRRGAFSGAKEDRNGLIQKAHRGTLFLDEIGELPPESQVALLRVLQDGNVRPVGGSDHIAVDVRFLAATHQDLGRLIAEGRFRQDLYARLAGFICALPPLRQRREDIGLLTGAILHRLLRRAERTTLHRATARALLRYDYPLNIRELEQALRASIVLAGDDEIRLKHLPEAIRAYEPTTGTGALTVAERALRDALIDAMRVHRGNVAAVGRAMGKAPMQIRRWCRRFEIDIDGFRSPT